MMLSLAYSTDGMLISPLPSLSRLGRDGSRDRRTSEGKGVGEGEDEGEGLD